MLTEENEVNVSFFVNERIVVDIIFEGLVI